MAEQSVFWTTGLMRMARQLDPFRATWRLFTNVRWAIGLITFLTLASLIGVLVPQMPRDVRGNDVLESDWVATQEERFGFLADAMNAVGLFDIFHADWFVYALGLLVVSVAVCTASRLPPIWRTVTRPRKRVPDTYFASAHHRYSYETASGGSRLESVLKRRWYAVDRYEEGETTYLFADRFQFAQLATFATHLALITLLAAALVSRFSGFSNELTIAEGSTAPVFPVRHSDQMQVQVLDTVGEFTPEGQPLDYRSDLVIHHGGEEAMRCTSTVNSPCRYNGYRFHQSAYFGFGADVQVRDLAAGNVIYRETLSLTDTLPSPHVIVRDEGVILDEVLVPTAIEATEDFVFYHSDVTLQEDRSFLIGVLIREESDSRELAVFEAGDVNQPTRLTLSEGDTASGGGFEFVYADLRAIPAAFIDDFPLPPEVATSRSGPGALLEMSNVVYGTSTASEGTDVDPALGEGPPRLTIVGLESSSVSLEPGESVQIEDYEYSFLGQREFAGIAVKRDRGDYLIWGGATLLVAGILVTLWVPRRRVWAKITSTETQLAGQAGHLAKLESEMEDFARQDRADTEGRDHQDN
jgi:cytochrome c biogenesis protein ResB